MNQFLDLNNVDNTAAQAEQKLMNTTYCGETRHWNFERYVTVHQEQHTILEGLVHHGHAGIDERSKTRYLMSGIKTNALDSVKTQILADTGLQNDFLHCVVLDLNISAVRIECEGGKDNKHKAATRVVVEDRYYTTQEYWALSNKQKLRLKELRGARGHQPSKRQHVDRKTSLKSQVAAIAHQLSVLQSIETRGEAASEHDGNNAITNVATQGNGQAIGNCDHPALTRQR